MSQLTEILKQNREKTTKTKKVDGDPHKNLPRNYSKLLGKGIEYPPEKDPRYALGHRPY